MSSMDPETAKQAGYEVSEEEIAKYKEVLESMVYTELGACDGFNYFLETPDPEKVKGEDPFPGFEDGYFEEYISLLDLDLIKDNIHLKGGAELRVPIEYASEGTEIHFETTDLDGNPVRSEELFAGHPVTMINLWATWCGPCINELPELEKINQEPAEQNCQIIGIVTDATNDEKIKKGKDLVEKPGLFFIYPHSGVYPKVIVSGITNRVFRIGKLDLSKPLAYHFPLAYHIHKFIANVE